MFYLIVRYIYIYIYIHTHTHIHIWVDFSLIYFVTLVYKATPWWCLNNEVCKSVISRNVLTWNIVQLLVNKIRTPWLNMWAYICKCNCNTAGCSCEVLLCFSFLFPLLIPHHHHHHHQHHHHHHHHHPHHHHCYYLWLKTLLSYIFK